MTLMLDPPPSTFPIDRETVRPLRCGLGIASKPQSRSLPRFIGHRIGSITSGTSSFPPASSNSTETSEVSASRAATTDPDEPDPQTMKSYWGATGESGNVFSIRLVDFAFQQQLPLELGESLALAPK